MQVPRVSEVPFFHLDCLKPELLAPWWAMTWREPVLTEILACLELDPPEFVSVIAPVKSGKTTLAWQLIDRLRNPAPNHIPILLEMRHLGHQATPDSVARYIARASFEQLREVLDTDSAALASSPQLGSPSGGASLRLDDLGPFLHELIGSLGTLLLVVDDIDHLPEDVRTTLLIFFRSLHANRDHNALLRKLSVVILATQSVAVKELDGVSPYNVAREYELPDLTREELGEFLDRCASRLDRISFTPEAVEYLFSQTRGHAILIQKICADAVNGVEPGQRVRIKHVLRGIARCFEYPEGYVSSLLDVDGLSPDVRDKLQRLVFQESVLPWHNVGEIVQRGIAKRGESNRCIFRSPLIHMLFVSKFDETLQRLQELRDLTQKDKDLAMLPQVSVLLFNRPLRREVEEQLARDGFELNSSQPVTYWKESYVSEASRILEQMDPPFDEQGMQYFVGYYFEEHRSPLLEKKDVLELVAKAWAADR